MRWRRDCIMTWGQRSEVDSRVTIRRILQREGECIVTWGQSSESDYTATVLWRKGDRIVMWGQYIEVDSRKTGQQFSKGDERASWGWLNGNCTATRGWLSDDDYMVTVWRRRNVDSKATTQKATCGLDNGDCTTMATQRRWLYDNDVTPTQRWLYGNDATETWQ